MRRGPGTKPRLLGDADRTRGCSAPGKFREDIDSSGQGREVLELTDGELSLV